GPAAPAPNSRIFVPLHAPAFVCAGEGVGAGERVGAGATWKWAHLRGTPSSSKNSREASCADAYSSRGELTGANMMFVSHAMSYSSAVVWRANQSPTYPSTSASSSSDAVVVS